MGRVFIIAKKDIKEAFRSRTTYFYVLFLCFLSVQYFASFGSTISSLTEQGATPSQIQSAGKSVMDVTVTTLPLVFTMLMCSILTAYSVAMDKAKRTMESLLATPLSLRQVWLGKSLAVALPGVAIAILVSLLIFLAMNLTIAVPNVGGFIVPSALPLVTGLVIVPVMAFVVVALVSSLQLIMSNQRLTNLAFIGIFFVIYFLSFTSLGSSWDFSLIYLVATIFLAVVTIFLTRFLTKERVILSSKG
jgi:ABC-2 type transport system permease protein